VWRISDSNR